ncbi:MAG TPA: DNA ligase D [Usitatibacter sp.]|nr:DNA ligase D [Usitatibacter sp.]
MPSSSLSTYWKKRDFGITGEPRGEVARTGKRLSFVIQKHAATRLHYDFRLELDGVLKSWAVPKGPSFDPRVRRMAVHTEDHPMSYAGFEGVIPKGQYGAGTVIVWDRGSWEPVGDPREGYRKGKLKFDLHGEKVRGRWNLVKMRGRPDERQETWLLIKEDDEEARPASEYDVTEALPDSVIAAAKAKSKAAKARKKPAAKATAKRAKGPHGKGAARDEAAANVPAGAVKASLPFAFFPQLATLVDEPPTSGDWVYEVKYDGYRLLARIDGDDVRLFTRNGNDWTSRLKALRDEVRALGIASAWLDGEIVVMDAKGNPSFQALQNAFDNSRTRDIVYFVFDAPHFGGYDLTRVPLGERRRIVEGILEGRESEHVRVSESFDQPADQLLAAACKKGLEGLIGKRANSIYVSARSPAWIKLKCTRRQEFVIAGYTDPKGSRTGFGSLLLGVHDADGKLVYAGNVGTGFDEKLLTSILGKLKPLASDKAPFAAPPRGVKGHWVRPKLIAEVAFTEWTSDGRIRHPVFHGLRTDKDPQAITREPEVDSDAVAPAKPGTTAIAKAAKAPARAKAAKPKESSAAAIKITHPDRVIDKSSGATKLDLVQYYESIAEYMIPHLVGRPIALVRAPTGIGGELFFQKHGEKIKIPGIIQLDRSFWPGHPAMLEIASQETLVGAAQMNVIEMHTWNSTTANIAQPDRVIFDLDPGEGIDWETLKEATVLTKKALDLLGLESFVKTSGGKGLHVVVPLTPKPEWDYDRVKDFSEQLVQHMAATLPQLFVSKSGARNRVGRIFIDYLRNGKGATTIAAFSARARPGLGVSVPVTWRELPKLTAANQWDIFNVHERLSKLRADPWKDYARTRQTLDAAAKKMSGK